MFDEPFDFVRPLAIAIAALVVRAEGHEPGGGVAPAPGGDQATPAAAAAAVPPPLTPSEAFEQTLPPASPRVIPTPPPHRSRCRTHQLPPQPSETAEPAAGGAAAPPPSAAATRSRLRGNHRHPLGGLGRRLDARARRALPRRGLGSKPDCSGPKDARVFSSGTVRGRAAGRRRMDPAQGIGLVDHSKSDRQHPGDPRCRHRRRVRHGFFRLRVLRFSAAGWRVHRASPGRGRDARSRAAARASTGRPWRRRRVRGRRCWWSSDKPDFLGAVRLHRERHAAAFGLARIRMWRWLAITTIVFGHAVVTSSRWTSYQPLLHRRAFSIIVGFLLARCTRRIRLPVRPGGRRETRQDRADLVGSLAVYLFAATLMVRLLSPHRSGHDRVRDPDRGDGCS